MSTGPQTPEHSSSDGAGRSRAPAPGEVATRSPATEQAYLARALWFESHAARHLGIPEPSPLEVAAFALEKRAEWAKSTWRQTKAALVFRYDAMGTSAAMEAGDLLRGGRDDLGACPGGLGLRAAGLAGSTAGLAACPG